MTTCRSDRMMRRYCLLLSVSVLLAALSSHGNAQNVTAGPGDPKELQNFVDSLIKADMTKERIPGAAFVFVKDGRVIMIRGYGLANVESLTPVVPESTIFRIGSISKVFTATAMVQLADRGLVDMNADVNKYLKKL